MYSPKMRLAFFIFILTLLALLTGCGGVAKMVNSATKLGEESQRLAKMQPTEIQKLVSSDIDIERIKRDPEGVLGQYVLLRGKANLEGTAEFPLKTGNPKFGKGGPNSGDVLLLDDTVFVIVLESNSLTGIKTGDEVEVLGLVSESRLLKEAAELNPKEKMPDLVTVIAKTVKKVEPQETPAPGTESAANKDKTVAPGKEVDKSATPPNKTGK
jgi:hypothetical protein